jgi:hypothetical protein
MDGEEDIFGRPEDVGADVADLRCTDPFLIPKLN